MEFTVRSSHEILATVDKTTGLLARIRTSANLRDGLFDEWAMPLILGVANYVQDCPLEEGCYAEPGGALRYALTSAFYALEVSGNTEFVIGQGSNRRRELNPQYRFGVLAASLAAMPAIIHSRIIIKTADGGSTWSPYHAYPRVFDWIGREGQGDGYVVEWRRERLQISQANAIAMAYNGEIYALGLWQLFDDDVCRQAHDAILPPDPKGPELKMISCVRKGDRTARELERALMTGTYTPVEQPPVSPDAIDAHAKPLNPTPAATADSTSPPVEPAAAVADADGVIPPPGSLETRPSPQGAAPTADHDALAAAGAPAEPDPWAGLPPHVLEMFDAIRAHPDYQKMKANWVLSETSIDVPVSTFGLLGRSPGAIARELKTVGMVVTGTAKSLVLKRSTYSLLFGEKDALVP